MPDGFAVEDLFAEYDGHLKNCIDLIWDTHTWKMRSSVPARFAGTCARCKRSRISCLDEAVAQIRNQQEVKDSFWEKVALKDYQIKKQFVEALSVILK